MKRIDSKEKSSVYYIGRGVIILSIIITSSLGFLVGFFVGKNMQTPVVNQASVTAPPAGTEQKNMDPPRKEAASPQQTQEKQQSLQPGIQVSQLTQETQTTQKPKQTIESGKVQAMKKTGVARIAEQSKETGNNSTVQESRQTTKPRETRETKKINKFTVQAGAFKNASDANALKAKLNKKGYKASVISTETKKHEKLYKVIIGEFTTKPEAELLSVKVKKAERLHTFVTVKN